MTPNEWLRSLEKKNIIPKYILDPDKVTATSLVDMDALGDIRYSTMYAFAVKLEMELKKYKAAYYNGEKYKNEKKGCLKVNMRDCKR